MQDQVRNAAQQQFRALDIAICADNLTTTSPYDTSEYTSRRAKENGKTYKIPNPVIKICNALQDLATADNDKIGEKLDALGKLANESKTSMAYQSHKKDYQNTYDGIKHFASEQRETLNPVSKRSLSNKESPQVGSSMGMGGSQGGK